MAGSPMGTGISQVTVVIDDWSAAAWGGVRRQSRPAESCHTFVAKSVQTGRSPVTPSSPGCPACPTPADTPSRARRASWSSARSWRCCSARSSSAASPARSASAASTSAPRISPRSPARARCGTSTRAVRAARDRRTPEPGAPRAVEYLALGRRAALTHCARNGAPDVDVTFPDGDASRRCVSASTVRDGDLARAGRTRRACDATAEAELAPPAGASVSRRRRRRRVPRPARLRQGKPMRPDVALAFDRMAAAAREDGVALIVTERVPHQRRAGACCSPATPTRSGSRRRASRCTGSAPSSTSARPRPTAGWRRNAPRFGFMQRYGWEPWHFGYALNAGHGARSASAARAATATRRAARLRPGAVRAGDQRGRRSAGACRRRCWPRSSTRSPASTRSRARPRARRASRSSCRGRARRSGWTTRSTPTRRSTPRPTSCATCCASSARCRWRWPPTTPARAPVAACRCVPPIPETQAYVADILGLLNGAGDLAAAAASGPDIRLVA